jgi:ATP-binding cassette subfamily B protein
MTSIAHLLWPASRAGEAIDALARAAGLSPRVPATEIPAPPASICARSTGAASVEAGAQPLDGWLRATASWLGIELEAVEAHYGEVRELVAGGGPALLAVEADGAVGLCALLGRGRGTVAVLDDRHVVHQVRVEVLARALVRSMEAPVETEIDRMLERARIPRRRHRAARAALLRTRLAERRVGGCWLLRPRIGSSLLEQARRARLGKRLVAVLLAHGAHYLLLLFAWWAVARGAFEGPLDGGWLAAWLLALATMVPLSLLTTWTAGMFAVDAGALLKARLLMGALRLEPDEIRHQGAGELLGQVVESEAVGTRGLSGGLMCALALVQLGVAAVVLGAGVSGSTQVLLLVGIVAVAVALGWMFFVRRRRWTDERLRMTNDLVERMVGHRTRAAQQAPSAWHDGEDQALAKYVASSERVDRANLAVSMLPRAWMLLGIAGLAPALLAGGTSLGSIAVGLGGVLLAHLGLRALCNGIAHLVGAAIGWRHAAPLVAAAARADVAPHPSVAAAHPEASIPAETTILEAHDVVFRYRDRGDPVLRGCTLGLRAGDRVLLEGASGAGKSTLALVLAGLRRPDSGLVLLRGLDRATLGAAGWRRHLATAPQFHDNHVLSGTFAYNLLLGGRWPPRPHDLRDAEDICRELELGPLLDRMPAGLSQQVGETGWQLSHGEKSRLYIARALLQRADLLVLDESFAALDPDTMQRALRCVMARAPALLVIAHP